MRAGHPTLIIIVQATDTDPMISTFFKHFHRLSKQQLAGHLTLMHTFRSYGTYWYTTNSKHHFESQLSNKSNQKKQISKGFMKIIGIGILVREKW
jgi:hypothetical protein